MNETAQWALKELYETISMLASCPQEQIRYLENLGTSPMADELALEFDDVRALVPQLVQQGWLTDEQSGAILALDKKLLEMSGGHNADLWTTDALRNDPCWVEVRRLASIAKETLGGSGEGKALI